jgi:hypothetical protein
VRTLRAPRWRRPGRTTSARSARSGNIEDQYNADLVPLLKLGQAGASSSQQAANARAMAAALQNVQDLTSEKGAAAAQYGYDILGQNNQIRDAQATRLLNILGQNNDTRHRAREHARQHRRREQQHGPGEAGPRPRGAGGEHG